MPKPFEEVEAVVIGGGMAGLAAAHALSGHEVVLLEESHRPGGRIFSQPAGDLWLNMGAHMFGEPKTAVGQLVTAMDLPSRPIGGRLMGISHKGRLLLRSRPEFYPFLLPLPATARLSFIRMGLALRRGTSRLVGYMRRLDGENAARARAQLLAFENDRTLADLIGPLNPEIRDLLRAFTERNGADPDEMSAGHGLRSFNNVWSRHAPGRNIVGGSSLLPEALARKLADRIRFGREVIEVRQGRDRVIVRYKAKGSVSTISAKAAVVAVPAFVARRIIAELPERTAAALDRIRYGAFLTAGVLTREVGRMPWDDNYAIATPGRRFSVLFNMTTTLRQGARRPGGSVMLFRGAKGAEAMMSKSDAAIEQAFADDLVAEFPDAKGKIEAMVIKRWETGAPFSAPGRARFQDDLTASLGRVILAGDYLEFPNLEAAVTTGQEAALEVLRFVGR